MRSCPTRLADLLVLCLLVLTAVSCYSDGESGGAPTEMNEELKTNSDFAQVLFVKAALESRGTWRFDVTVRHQDEGWDHYADLWQVVNPQSMEVLGKRVLAHPHDNEQPFTRSESGIHIPSEVTNVLVQAKCNLHGFEGKAITVDLSLNKGDDYTVNR